MNSGSLPLTHCKHNCLQGVNIFLDTALTYCEYLHPVNDLQRRVRAWLKRNGRNQDWLAAELGISKSYLSMLLSRKRTPSLALAIHLNELTRVPVGEFVSEPEAQGVA